MASSPAPQARSLWPMSPPARQTDSFDLALADAWLSVTPTKEADAARLIRELSIGRAMLAQLAELAADGSVELRIAFFAGSVVEMGDLEIGVDEYVEKRRQPHREAEGPRRLLLARRSMHVHAPWRVVLLHHRRRSHRGCSCGTR